MIEEWKDCVGFEGFYEVSSFGNVRRYGKNKYLTATINKDGYHQYVFSVKNKRKNICGHQLVTTAFIGPCPQGMEPCHNDGNGCNNYLSNLRYDTHKANADDAVKHGTMRKGSMHGRSILTEADIPIIRASTQSNKELSKLFGVSNATIWQIRKGNNWKTVK